jgi:integrase
VRHRGQPKLDRFQIGGYYLDNPHPERGGYWYACRFDARTRVVRRRSLKTKNFEQAKIKLAALIATAPQSSIGAPSPNDVMTVAVLDAYLEDRGQHIASEEAAQRAVQLFTEYLQSIGRLEAKVAFWTPSQQLEFARWCVAKHNHSAGYIERLFNVARAAFNDACQVKIRPDAVGNKIEAALMSHAPKVVWKRDNISKEMKIPARRPRPPTLSIDQMAVILDHLRTPHLFRFAIMSLCTWARPQAIIDFDPGTQVDVNDRTIDLAPVGWVQTKKRRPRQPLTQCFAGWLTTWHEEDLNRQAKARMEGREQPSSALIVYRGRKVATVKRAMTRAGVELGLMGFSQYSFRHFMADQVKKLFRGVPREHRSLWMGHVVRDGSRTTDNYESDDPHVLVDVALATDCVMALIQEHCDRRLFAIEPLLNRKELEKIGARTLPKSRKRQRVDGGRDRDRTCDPYHVKVVLFR